MTEPIAGVILAGGQARRMGGGDKCLLEIGGRPLLSLILARLVPQVDAVALNANGDPARFAAFDLPVVPDANDARDGPLSGVLAGMDWAASQGYDQIVTVAGDTPFFPEHLTTALRLAAMSEGTLLARAETPRGDGGFDRHPTFGLWSVDLREPLRTALAKGTRKVIAFTDPLGCARVTFAAEGDPFFNVNTPEDLEKARAR